MSNEFDSIVITDASARFGVPVGTYRAEFLGLKKNQHPQFGDGLEWSFRIKGGGFDGKLASRTTATTIGPTNSAGVLLAGMLGRPLQTGEKANLASMKGEMFQVVVETNTGKGTRIASARPIAAAPPPRRQPPAPVAPPGPAPVIFWVDFGNGTPALMEVSAIHAEIKAGRIVDGDLFVCRENSQSWEAWASVPESVHF